MDLTHLDARRTLNVAYALLIDGDPSFDTFGYWAERISAPLGWDLDPTAPLVGARPDPEEEARVEAQSKWDRDTWGTTPEAQEDLVRALEMLGA